MPSDTKPMPAAEFRRLMSELVTAANEYANDSIDSRKLDAAIAACMTALRSSPVTLEEALLKEWHDRNREQSRGLTFAGPAQAAFHFRCTMGMLNHARTLAETDNARRLAGEGGA